MFLSVLSLVVICIVSVLGQQCGPTPQSGVSYDFSPVPSAVFTGFDGRQYSVYPCGEVFCDMYGSPVACMSWSDSQSYYASLGIYPGTWSYINPNDPTQGAQLQITQGIDYYDFTYCPTLAPSAVILFQCLSSNPDDSMTLTTPGSINAGCLWTFTVNSKAVCAAQQPIPPAAVSSSSTADNSGGGGNDKTDDKAGLGGGWVFIIILVVVIFVYCVGGMSFMHFQRGASGSAIIPNIGFWRELPGLIKDGCVFTWRKTRALCAGGGGSSGGGEKLHGGGSGYNTMG